MRTIDTLSSAGNDKPVGVWSDGTTMWVSDHLQGKLYAYALDSGAWLPSWDVEGFASENNRPQGIWSDGSKMWVVDKFTDKVFIYDLPDDARLASLEATDVNLDAFSPNVAGYARNVAGDVTSVTVSAETVRDGATVAITPADADSNSSNGHQVTLVTNGETTITVTVTHGSDTKVYTLTLTQLENTTKPLSSDATLSALTLSGIALSPSFDSDTTLYRSTMTATQFADGLTTEVTATKNNTNAEFDISPDDGDGDTMGHQVKTTGGGVTVEITVTAQDGSTRTYTVLLGEIRRDPDEDFSINLVPGSTAYDIWSDGETMWVLYSSTSETELFAYDLETKARTPERDYHRNYHKEHRIWDIGMWSDGNLIWTSQMTRSPKIKAIDATSYISTDYLADESFPSTGSGSFRDLWSDGETFWVARIVIPAHTLLSSVKMLEGKLWAYDFETKDRKSDKDLTINTTGDVSRDTLEDCSFGIWSDGTILWVVSNEGNDTSTLEAHKLSDGSRVPSMDIQVGEDGILHPRNMWSNGRTMWVLESYFDRSRVPYPVHAYTLPPNAKLFSLEMSGVDFGHFIHGRPKYTATVGSSVDETTVSWEQAHTGGSAAVAIKAVDKDDNESTTDADMKEGYQVSLAEGENVITITVTAPNGTDTYAYTVTVTRAPS